MARLSDEQIEEQLSGLPGWQRDGEAISRQFELDDFKGSVDFVNRLTPEAEGMNHHPDLEISWNKVSVTISTHSEGGLTENDFELARKVDAVGGSA
ncbi:MAG TPA: 4a-hydroxytetrahydrobiopterin dehydratase [Thermoleophilaceae bacterium]|nr:4a-hydroxytetrahydrobiopterin dehydratase [Actinomycetota bacterium]HYN52090.1 4a-hydroxytetrahydrobiopterin dehydratase [Thermoleophilaceae bacterium]